MRTRIDHLTVITWQASGPVVLEDTSVTFAEGVISEVKPTSATAAEPIADVTKIPPLHDLRGRPLGRILIRAGIITRTQLGEALERQRQTHGVVGQQLVDLGFVTDEEVDWALAVQAGRDPGKPVPHDGVRVIDGRGQVAIPGLINTHHHLFQSLTRAMPKVQNAPLFDWLTALYPRWAAVDRGAVHQAALIGLAELLVGGCTTTSDHMYLFPPKSDVALEAILEAAEQLGIRIHACRGSMSLGQSAGGLPPDDCVEDEETILSDCGRVVRLYHDPKVMAMRRIDLAPCAPFNVTPRLLEATRELAAEYNLLLHTHIAETLDEERFCRERYGCRPVEYLRRQGWLGPNVYLAHCVHLNDEEIALLAETGTKVAHCPGSNARLGSGIAPIRRMLDAGVKVGLGVDGSSSNDGASMLAEARLALLLQRAQGEAGAMTAGEAFRMATLGGAEVLLRPELGRIEAGAAADLVLYDAGDVALAGAIAQDPLGAMVLCQVPRPRRVLVAGRTVVEEGRVVGLDLDKVVADFNQMVRRRFASGPSV